jgi:hypothetical protein
MKTIRHRLHINRMAVFLLSGIALIGLLLASAHGLTRLVKKLEQDRSYAVADRFLQAQYVDYDGKALIAQLPGRAVQCLLTGAQRERDAWVQEICADLTQNKTQFPGRYRWELAEVVPMSDAGEPYFGQYQALIRRYIVQYGALNPSEYNLVRVRLHELNPDGSTKHTHEQEYVVVCIDGKWYMDYDSAVKNYPALGIAAVPSGDNPK